MISIIVPVYQSKKTLPELYNRLIDQLNKNEEDFEIIFVDDHSDDGSWEVIKAKELWKKMLRYYFFTT